MIGSRRGTTPIEYSLIAVLVSVFILGAVVALGDAVRERYEIIVAAVSP